MEFWSRLYIDLKRLLPVQFDGEVDHVSASQKAVGWGVGPSACNVNAYGRTSPDDLVLVGVKLWQLGVLDGCVDQLVT